MATAELDTAGPILDSLRGRRPDGRWGIGTARSYLDATPPNLFGVSPSEWQAVMEKAGGTLTYCEQGATIEPLPWSVLGEEGRQRLGRNMELLPVKAAKKPAGLDGFVLVFDYTLTTVDEDRDFDILEPKGATVDELGPLLFNHVSIQPIGKFMKILKRNSKRLAEQSAIMDFPFGRDVAQMVEFQVLRRMSHGFLPTKYEERRPKKGDEEDGALGWHILEYEIMERSVVSVASNRGAIIEAWNLLGEKGFQDNRVKGWLKSVYEARPVIGRGFRPEAQLIRQPAAAKSTSSTFDVWREHLEPASLEYDWVSRYIGCQVKHLFWVHTAVPRARVGSWLTGLREILAEYDVEDTRHITHGGDELPPKYEIIQLTPEKTEDFLVQGLQFRCGTRRKFVVGFEPYYGMLEVTFYTSDKEEDRQFARDVIDKTWQWSRQNNFLKGQAFSLTGGFLPKTDEQWDGLFLPARNKAPVMRAVGSLNETRAAAPNRGMVLMGPPGTGKTLSARIMRNQAEATFIWVAARDFWQVGVYGALTHAFDLARELAPSIVCFEDVDNWMGRGGTEDLLKSEMDGMGRSSGIVTLLTTNYPELIPDSLIDRPGRFHDVLLFDLPDAKTRAAMLASWLPEAAEKDRKRAVEKMDGYSGAHISELVQYARAVREEEDLLIGEALVKAIDKIEEQRELINGVQLEGSRYKPTRSMVLRSKTVAFGNKTEGAVGSAAEVKGMVPGNPPGGSGEGAEGIWRKLRLSDFTDKQWGELSAAEKGKIKRYFAWHPGTVETFDDLKLGHHFPPGSDDAGKASLNGVRNALARANQVDGIGDDLERVMEHLRAHLPEKGLVTRGRNDQRIRWSRDDMAAIVGTEDVPRRVRELAVGAASRLNEVLRSIEVCIEGDEKSTGKGPEVIFAWLAAAATQEELRQAKAVIDGRLRQKRNRSWRRLLGLK